MLTKSETTAKPPSCHSLQAPPGYPAFRSCRMNRVRGIYSDSRRRRSGLLELGTVPKLAHAWEEEKKVRRECSVPGELGGLREPKTSWRWTQSRANFSPTQIPC